MGFPETTKWRRRNGKAPTFPTGAFRTRDRLSERPRSNDVAIGRWAAARRPNARRGHRLANVPYRDQWTVQRRRDEIAKKVRRLRRGHSAFSGVFDHGGDGGTVIGLCVGKDVPPYGIEAHSRENAIEITRLAGAGEGMVLYRDVCDKPGEPRFVASFKQPS